MTKNADDRVYTAETTEIYVPEERQRRQFDPKRMQELVVSIKELGQLQPGVCTMEDGRPRLVCGWRRLMACTEAGIPYTYILKEEIEDELTLEKIELEENLVREDLHFLDECAAIERLHRILQEEHGTSGRRRHGVRETARYLDVSKSQVQDKIQIAQAAQAMPELRSTKNITEAKKMVKGLVNKFSQTMALNEALARAKDEKAPTTSTPKQGTEKDPLASSDIAQRLLYYDRQYVLGSFDECVPTLPDEQFGVVIFDPPWGVEFDTVYRTSVTARKYEDTREAFLALFPAWINTIYEKMAPDSHLYLFFGIVHYQFVYDTLHAAGFETNGMPLFWHKKGQHRTRQPDKWHGRCYEPIAYARKGTRPLSVQGGPDIITTAAPTQALKGVHPSAKHPEIIRVLLERSARPGDYILDPMAGSGATALACESLRPTHSLTWTCIDQESEYRNQALYNLNQGYDAVVARNTGPIGDDPEDAPEDFKHLKPGSDAWVTFWRQNPDRRDEMMAWREENSKSKGGSR